MNAAPATHPSPLRVALWSIAGALLLLPLVAMQFTDEVNWTGSDFAFAAVLLGGTGLAFEAFARTSRRPAYRAGAALALAGAFLLVWLNAAVGMIGSEDNPANAMYAGVIAVGVIGAVVARFRAPGMTWALGATALAQAVVAAVALVGGMGVPENSPLQTLVLNGGFVALFAASALLFRRAAQSPEPSETASL